MDKNKTGAELIAAERQRQIHAEGYLPRLDALHKKGELNCAACCYLGVGQRQVFQGNAETGFFTGSAPAMWPWDADAFKPAPDAIRNLVKAGALIAAEIDRLQRARCEAV